MDRTIKEGSRISKLPMGVRPFAVILREALLKPLVWRKPGPTMADFHHVGDGIATKHLDDFRTTERFKTANARAVRASGWDYQIPYRIHQALWCSHQAQKVPGDYVEIGTGRGYMMSAILADFKDWENCGRSVHLFDTFSPFGLDASGKQRADGEVSQYYAVSAEQTASNFSEWSRININQGDVFETLPKAPIRQIALLHIDLNAPAPEVFALKFLWDRMPRGGVVLLDDFAYSSHEKQHEAMNVVAAELGIDILSTPTGQGIIVK